MLVYHKQIEDSQEVLALPLINKVVDGKIVLQGYTLDSGHFIALANSIKQTQLPRINAIYFDNCGIDDDELALLLEGLIPMDCFKTFVYINNVFEYAAMEAIKPILLHKYPRELQELRLVNVYTQP